MEFLDDKESVNKLLQAQSHVWNCTLNFINSTSLKCAIELGIPDIVESHGRQQQQPITLSALVAALPINPNKAHCVYRLMRILVQSGFFALQKIDANNQEEEGYSLTESSRLLLKGHPFSLASFVILLNNPILTKPFQHLSSWLLNDDEPTAFSVAHGEPYWKFSGHEPEFGQAFDEVMASDSLLIGHLLTSSKCKVVFEGLESLVDVAGGTGNMAKAIAKAFPELDCTVLDLPHVLAGLPDTKNVKYVPGDMFQSIPPADAVLLKWILHDWGDEDCVKILKKCKEAIMNKGKVIIIDMVIGNQNLGEKATEAQLFYDMEMMVVLNGRERNEQEWGKLFVNAGFSHYKISPVFGVRALIELILHDWNDEDCVKILKLCKEAIKDREGGKVIIIEIVMGDRKGDDDVSVETQLFNDMLMMMLATGKERTEKEWSKLFKDASFSDYKITSSSGLRSIIELCP